VSYVGRGRQTARSRGYSGPVQRRLPAVLRRRGVVVGLQIAFVVAFTAVLGWFLRDTWRDALPLLRHADLLDIGIALVVMAAYYLMFVVGWQWILAGLGIRIGYPLALQAEMASMLAKYVPGTVWTPIARILWLRRAGVDATSVVFGSIALEAGLSAISGVLVFALGLAILGESSATLLPLVTFAVIVAVLLHPRVFVPLSRRAFARIGWPALPVLSYRAMLGLLLFYGVSWLVGGVAVLFLVRSLGADPGWSSVPYLGGTAAVGAIVTVLSVFSPSGLGVREGSMYGLLLALVPAPVALGVTVLNRLAITIVEAVLLALGIGLWWAARGSREQAAPAGPAPAERA
jgi:uncharacterized membrane protein YbhN (UPF0104 family)